MSEQRRLPPIALDPEGVVFDLDGVLCDTEPLWLEARDEVADEVGGQIVQDDYSRFYGANTSQWSAAMAEILNHPDPSWIAERTVDALLSRYRTGRVRPIVSGVEAVRRAAARGPLAIASGSPRLVIATLLEILGLADVVTTYVSCDEVASGKPAPDVYLEACRRIDIAPSRSLAIEDSANGARAAKAAGMTVVLVPMENAHAAEGGAEIADVVVGSLDELPFDAR